MRTSVAVGSVVALGLAVGLVLQPGGNAGAGTPADFGFTLKDPRGQDVRLADFKGKPLVVNFFASWCVPCQIETPELVRLYGKFKGQGLAIIAISIDDTPAQIQQFASDYRVPYPLLVGFDRDDVKEAFGLATGIPTTVFVSHDGMILGRLEGIATPAWMEKQIRALF